MNKDTAKDGYLREIMSMHHSRDSTKKLIPAVGDVMVTSRRKPILTIIEESGPGVHDTVYAACNHELYEQLLGIKPEVSSLLRLVCSTTTLSSYAYEILSELLREQLCTAVC